MAISSIQIHGIITEYYIVYFLNRREGIIVNEYASYPSNIKAWICIGLLLIHFKWSQVH